MLQDLVLDTRLRASAAWRRMRSGVSEAARLRVLVVGIEVPSRRQDIHRTVERLTRGTRHTVDVSIVPMRDGLGKFANIDAAVAGAPAPLASYDWAIICDDDVGLPHDFLDTFLMACVAADLAIAQPAHRRRSFATYEVTRRRPGAIVRATHFVEIGPLTAVRKDTFADLIPFPSSRWCYGIDGLWSELAKERGWRMGVVDATPVRHLRPVAGSYDMDLAREEGRKLLEERGVTLTRTDMLGGAEVLLPA